MRFTLDGVYSEHLHVFYFQKAQSGNGNPVARSEQHFGLLVNHPRTPMNPVDTFMGEMGEKGLEKLGFTLKALI